MKLNEVTQGRKIYVIVHLDADSGHIDDISLDSAFSSFKAADHELKQMWVGFVEDENEELAKQLRAAIDNDKKFEKLAAEAEGPFPSWDELFDYYIILETRLK